MNLSKSLSEFYVFRPETEAILLVVVAGSDIQELFLSPFRD
jgi:hypothetical protein